MSDSFDAFLDALRHDLAGTLPGPEAQYRMAPRPRTGAEIPDKPRADARQGGVLILLYPHEQRIRLPLILRATYRGVHSGQVGLPGGGREEIDTDLQATALREAYEEIGVHPDAVTVLGRLTTLYVYASNYVVHPFVGWTKDRPNFHTDPYEVAKLIEIRLDQILDPANQCEEMWELRSRSALVPYYSIGNEVVWGATAMILSELTAMPSVAGRGAGTDVAGAQTVE